ncbi:hypothetical protein [Clostridium sp. UBA871]|uniref:hypothetical protein n=1 Tax=Clostridium sp. UBA871 TaxID=1946380 RepID=UPI003216C5D4
MKNTYIKKIHSRHIEDSIQRKRNYDMYEKIIYHYLSMGESLNISCEKVYINSKLEKYNNKYETMRISISAAMISSIIMKMANPEDMMGLVEQCRSMGKTILENIPNIRSIKQGTFIIVSLIMLVALSTLISLGVLAGVLVVEFAFSLLSKKAAIEIEYYSMCLEVLILLEEKKFVNNYNETEKINCVREKVQLDKYKRRHQEDTSPILDEKYSILKIQNNNDKHSNIST